MVWVGWSVGSHQIGFDTLPETPSPKKKIVGAGLIERYGRMARDLSCPKLLAPVSVYVQRRVVGQAGEQELGSVN
jgi:hypothetical protein